MRGESTSSLSAAWTAVARTVATKVDTNNARANRSLMILRCMMVAWAAKIAASSGSLNEKERQRTLYAAMLTAARERCHRVEFSAAGVTGITSSEAFQLPGLMAHRY